MEIRDLVYFLQAAHSGHFGRAATALGLTQPALTKCIARLERELNAPLFERTPRGVKLTYFGEHALRNAQRLKTAFDDVRKELADISNGSRGHLQIGTGLAMAQNLVPEACIRLTTLFPAITLQIIPGTGRSLAPLLLEGQIDLVFSGIPAEPEPGLAHELIMEDQLVVVARHTHPLRRKRGITVHDLSAARWVLPKPGSLSTTWLERRFLELGASPPKPTVETDSVSALLAMVAESDLLTFQSWPSIRRSPLHSVLRPLDTPSLVWSRRVGATYRAGGYLPSAGKHLIRLFKEVAVEDSA